MSHEGNEHRRECELDSYNPVSHRKTGSTQTRYHENRKINASKRQMLKQRDACCEMTTVGALTTESSWVRIVRMSLLYGPASLQEFGYNCTQLSKVDWLR